MSEIANYLGSSHLRPDGSTVEIQTRWALLDVGAVGALAKAAKSLGGSGVKATVVFDRWTRFAQEGVARALVDAGVQVVLHEVQGNADGSPPVADTGRVAELERALHDHGGDVAVAVGAGTINDITKMAAHRRGLPYLSFGTAASMNGYTSGIAALYEDGLKVTTPATPPVGVFADPEVVAQAPQVLTLAGLGDLCSKPFATADAAVAAIAVGETPWRFPAVIVESVFDEVLGNAGGIGVGEPEAVAHLMEALWVSGVSMVIAGSSAPASGGEHLWSHRLDMARHDQGLPPLAYHGTQVGVACGLVRPLFEDVAAADPDHVVACLGGSGDEPDPSNEIFSDWLAGRHPDLSEASLRAVGREAARKYELEARGAVRAGLGASWGAVREELVRAGEHARVVQDALNLALAPTQPEDLGMDGGEAQRILGVCRDIRNRLTILDLAAAILP